MAKQSTDTAWADPLRDTQPPPLPGDRVFDVCVVGAGIAGLTTAYLLAGAGRTVLVIDHAESPGGGETRYTSAHLSDVIDDRFTEVARVRGADAARLAHESHRAAIDRIESIVTTEHIECGFRRVDGYLFPAPGDEKTIDREYEAAKAAGCRVEKLPDVPIRSFGKGPCLRFARQAAFEPTRYMAGLWEAARRRGVTFHGKTRAKGVTGGGPAAVETDRGTVRSNAVVVASNTPFYTRVVMQNKLAAYQTYVIAGPVPRGSVPDGLFWDTQDPYHYVRLIRNTDRGDADPATELLLVGGGDHRTGQASDPGRRWDDLEQWARERFSQMGPVEYRWSGEVMETLDGLAYIGADPTGMENVYLVTGDSGMGLTHGTIAGILLSDRVLGRPNPWTDLFDPGRLPLLATPWYVGEGTNVARQYTDWLTGGDVKSVDDIAPGQGAVVRRGLTKLAVYRDPSGTVHACSAVCPHLGAIVQWNPAEQTWDCPAHGSRFTAQGEVFHGPANCRLSKSEA